MWSRQFRTLLSHWQRHLSASATPALSHGFVVTAARMSKVTPANAAHLISMATCAGLGAGAGAEIGAGGTAASGAGAAAVPEATGMLRDEARRRVDGAELRMGGAIPIRVDAALACRLSCENRPPACSSEADTILRTECEPTRVGRPSVLALVA